MIGSLLRRANIAGPGFATNLGPRGPSIVNATSRPSSSRFDMITSASSPPLVELPCAVPNPRRSITRRVHCPSKFVLFITTIPRFRAHHTTPIIAQCQNEKMQRRPAAYVRSMCWYHTSSIRSVGPSARITPKTAAAITGICIRRQREYCGVRTS